MVTKEPLRYTQPLEAYGHDAVEDTHLREEMRRFEKVVGDDQVQFPIREVDLPVKYAFLMGEEPFIVREVYNAIKQSGVVEFPLEEGKQSRDLSHDQIRLS